jgi:hypothetical protein
LDGIIIDRRRELSRDRDRMNALTCPSKGVNGHFAAMFSRRTKGCCRAELQSPQAGFWPRLGVDMEGRSTGGHRDRENTVKT